MRVNLDKELLRTKYSAILHEQDIIDTALKRCFNDFAWYKQSNLHCQHCRFITKSCLKLYELQSNYTSKHTFLSFIWPQDVFSSFVCLPGVEPIIYTLKKPTKLQ